MPTTENSLSNTADKRWYSIDKDNVLNELGSSANGLSTEEVKIRLKKYGLNELRAEDKTSPLKLLLEQFSDLLVIILIIAAVISAGVGQMVEAIAIIIIVILAGVLGFIQEFQAGKAIESLKKMAAPHARVLRNGEVIEIEASEIVPGDIVLIAAGDSIPADSRIIESQNLRIDEAPLTGESTPVDKSAEVLEDESISIGDRHNMLFMGTNATYGRGKAVVVGTGMNTEFGKIADMLQSTENRKTPLQLNLDQLGKKIGIFSIILAAVMSLLGILRGNELIEMFVWGVAVAVAVIPEALPAVVTISIALGVRRMVKRKALIRKLPAVETLGATNIICSDKTGTLTQDQMTIRKIYTVNKEYELTGVGYKPEGNFLIGEKEINPAEDEYLIDLLKTGTLCNDTKLFEEEGKWKIIGDPTEGSIIVAAEKAGIKADDLRNEFERLNEIPFSSETKRMTTFHEIEGIKYAFSKGAPEVIVDSCTHYYNNGKLEEITDEVKKEIMDSSYRMGKEALRVLGIAKKEVNKNSSLNEDEQEGLTFLGLVGMIDPPRPEVKSAIETCFKAGIKPIMITGDHSVTAVAVARELGIFNDGNVITGTELESYSDEDIEKISEKTEVFARISPFHKLKIVEALMNKGHIVAMTGDGVNDAPSLKKADIGVAMGIKGTDVSREASDMILTDDNFASIVSAVEEGRSIFENIRKYLIYLLSGNFGTVFGMAAALIMALPIPLHAVQILFINFLMDGLIAIALGVEPAEKGMMNKKPRKVEEGILNRKSLIYIGGIGTWIGIITYGIFVWALNSGMEENKAVTMFFVTLIFARLFNGLNCRSLDVSYFKIKQFSNLSLLYSILFSMATTFVVTYSGFFQEAFRTIGLTLNEWLIVIGVSATTLVFVELGKLLIPESLNNRQ